MPVRIGGAYGPPVAGQYSVNGDQVTYAPLAPFPGNTLIVLSVGSVRDLAGNYVTWAQSSFTTGAAQDTTPPMVLLVTPRTARKRGVQTSVVLTFSESLSQSTINSSNFAAFANGALLNTNMSRPRQPDRHPQRGLACDKLHYDRRDERCPRPLREPPRRFHHELHHILQRRHGGAARPGTEAGQRRRSVPSTRA